MDGFQLCRLCKQIEQVRHIPFVFYTSSYTSDKDEQFGLSLGANAFIRKPADSEALARKLLEVFEKAKSGLLSPPEVAPLEPSRFFDEYSERLVTKLDKKVAQLEREVAERKRAEEEVRESERRLRSLFDTMAEGVVLINPDGQIVQANAAAERLLGLKLDEIEGRNYISPEWEILRPDGMPMPPEEMAGPIAMKEKRLVTDVEMGVKRPNGATCWLSVSAAPIIGDDDSLEGVVGTFVDITERKRAEEELKKGHHKL
jgi:PAS domain S-box-containing protein